MCMCVYTEKEEQSDSGKGLALGNLGGDRAISLYYLCNFPVSLIPFQNKRLEHLNFYEVRKTFRCGWSYFSFFECSPSGTASIVTIKEDSNINLGS